MIPKHYDGDVFLQVAGNDCADHDAQFVIRSYEDLLRTIRNHAPNCRISVGQIPQRRGGTFLRQNIKTVNEHLKHSSADFFVECPVYFSQQFKRDGVHFNKRGLHVYASNLATHYSQVFRETQTPLLIK